MLSIAALLVTLFALAVVGSSNANNVAGDVILDAIFLALAFWVDSRAVHAWRRLVDASRARAPDSS